MLRTFRTSSRAIVRTGAISRMNVTRGISTTSRRSAGDHHTPPALLGDGAPDGTIPTEVNQATGLERLQILGHMDGVDVFDMQPLEVTRLGTKKDPIAIKSYVSTCIPSFNRMDISEFCCFQFFNFLLYVGAPPSSWLHWFPSRFSRYPLA